MLLDLHERVFDCSAPIARANHRMLPQGNSVEAVRLRELVLVINAKVNMYTYISPSKTVMQGHPSPKTCIGTNAIFRVQLLSN